jgi:LysM repeat protein
MNSEKSIELKSGNPLQENDLQRIEDFVDVYSVVYKKIEKLEAILQSLLKEQKEAVELLQQKRTEEEEFFQNLASREGVSVSYLKVLAADWATIYEKTKSNH